MISLSLNTVMLVVILIVVIPFSLFIWADKAGKAKKKKKFLDVAKSQDLKFSEAEYWNNSCMGYDKAENTLIYINVSENETKFQKVDLDDVRKCAINRISKEFKNGDKHHSELSRLDLEFTFISNAAPVRITLFATEENFSQNEEMPRAEKWLEFVDQHKYNKNKVTAA